MSRREGKRPSQRDHSQMMLGGGTCPTCGKTRYLSKPAAKKAIRQMPSRAKRLHAYACGEYWHIGEPPKAVVKGLIARDELGPPRLREPYSWRPKGEAS